MKTRLFIRPVGYRIRDGITVDCKMMMNFTNRAFIFTAAMLFAIALNGCTQKDVARHVHQSALEKGFTPEIIPAGIFNLYAIHRINSPDSDVHIYIEGDGFAWVTRTRPSRDPTPKNPLALDLAIRDKAGNVIYLARPCQYIRQELKRNCDARYWTSHRFAPEVLNAYDAALTDLKKRYGFHTIHLIGYSGGANIAALLAYMREDVASLRTVAGNLDHALVNSHHGVSRMPASLNAVKVAAHISDIPQHHMAGEEDDIILPFIIDRFVSALGDTSCASITRVRGATHHDGWAERWPELMDRRIECHEYP